MSLSTPDVLVRLLDARDANARQPAWEAFLRDYSGLLLHVSRSRSGDHDAVMNCYEFVVDKLSQDDFARLRRYVPDGHGKFTTWLLVVVRRLCVDHHRHRYGRAQTEKGDRHIERRRLTDLVGDSIGLDVIASDEPADQVLLNNERDVLLGRALERLTPTDRLILRMRFDDDLSVPEIARLLGASSPFAMYRRLQNTLAAVRRELERAGIQAAS